MILTPIHMAIIAFVAVSLIVAIGWFLFARDRSDDEQKVLDRLRGISSAPMPSSINLRAVAHWIGSAMRSRGDRQPGETDRPNGDLQTRLLRAGFLNPRALPYFRSAKLILTVALAGVGGTAAFWFDGARPTTLACSALCGAAAGFLVPGLWLSLQISKRQRLLDHAVPDALDMLVMCMEGGVSLNAALQRVTDELHFVHPILGMEMNIIMREIQLGLTAGEALKKFSARCGLPDVRELAMVILQSERYGASLGKTLRGYAESARLQRQQKTEETAQKAAVKVLFPTLLCIFPAIFIVILGPAAIQTATLFAR